MSTLNKMSFNGIFLLILTLLTQSVYAENNSSYLKVPSDEFTCQDKRYSVQEFEKLPTNIKKEIGFREVSSFGTVYTNSVGYAGDNKIVVIERISSCFKFSKNIKVYIVKEDELNGNRNTKLVSQRDVNGFEKIEEQSLCFLVNMANK